MSQLHPETEVTSGEKDREGAPSIDLDTTIMSILTPEGRRDPYPLYRSLRLREPVYRSEVLGPVFLTRYEDCKSALVNPSLGKWKEGLPSRQGLFFAETSTTRAMRAVARSPDRLSGSSMLMANPPDHTRLRKLVSQAFTPRRVEILRPKIVQVVEELFDSMADEARSAGATDVMAGLAYPLPIAVIGELMGVPEHERSAFQPIVRDATLALEPGIDEGGVLRFAEAMGQLEEYFSELLARRRLEPEDDLLSALALASEGDDQLTDAELVSTAILIFGAGFETTANLIGNGLLALLTHPDQFAVLRNDVSLAKPAIEELLRWDSPVQVDARFVLAPTEVAGCPLDTGEIVMTFLGAANRDPAVFDDPDNLDLVRQGPSPMSFGGGIHFCLGASLARLEGQVVLETLARGRWGLPELGNMIPDWRTSVTFRGLDKLEMSFAPPPRGERNSARPVMRPIPPKCAEGTGNLNHQVNRCSGPSSEGG